MQRFWLWCKTFGLLTSWLVALAVMYVAFRLDPPLSPDAIAGTSFAGMTLLGNHNLPGELERTIILSIVELVILSSLLRPWSNEPLPPRLIVAIVLLLFWMVLFGVATLQSGVISKINLLWLLGVWLFLLLELAGVIIWNWLRSLR
jgi:hypothetical protein